MVNGALFSVVLLNVAAPLKSKMFLQANVVGSALYATGAAEGMVSNFGPNGILAKDILPDGKWWLFLYEWTFNICNIIVGIVGAGDRRRDDIQHGDTQHNDTQHNI